jgi:DNA-binding CsgD family transcriptional regulator
VRLGRLRARQGRLEDARALFEGALPSPEAIVGLGELDLLAGDRQAAVEAAERALRNLSGANALDRFTALELLACASGQADAAAELEATAERLGTPYMRARGRLVRARVDLDAGDHTGARCAAEDAVDAFTGCSAPYEAAQARLVLAAALAELGRPGRAEAEERAARDALAALGGGVQAAARGELSPRELDILRLVAQGLSDAQIGGRLFLSPHTVHRHVANIRARLRVPSRAAAVAHATRAGLL